MYVRVNCKKVVLFLPLVLFFCFKSLRCCRVCHGLIGVAYFVVCTVHFDDPVALCCLFSLDRTHCCEMRRKNILSFVFMWHDYCWVDPHTLRFMGHLNVTSERYKLGPWGAFLHKLFDRLDMFEEDTFVGASPGRIRGVETGRIVRFHSIGIAMRFYVRWRITRSSVVLKERLAWFWHSPY